MKEDTVLIMIIFMFIITPSIMLVYFLVLGLNIQAICVGNQLLSGWYLFYYLYFRRYEDNGG